MKFEVRVPDYGEDFRVIEDRFIEDPEEAAQAYVEKHFSDWEYPQGPIEVEVRDEDGFTSTVEVTIEYEPVFSASTIEPKPKQCFHVRYPEQWKKDGVCWTCKAKYNG